MIIASVKLITSLLRRLTAYSGTALPGLILEKYFPSEAKKLFSQLDKVIAVTGTNGKTTTVHMISHLLRENNIPFLTNHSGSNMTRGLLSTLLDHSNWSGKLRTTLAILEVEEATLPRLVKVLKPHAIVVTNIYRDQLDAYGEVDKTYEYLATAIKEARGPNLILNGDDERVLRLAEFSSGYASFVSFEEAYRKLIKNENRMPILENKEAFMIGGIKTDDDNLANNFEIRQGKNSLAVFEPIPGIFNCFSATVALLAFADIVGLDLYSVSQRYNISLEKIHPAFGRGEILECAYTKYQIFLGKNPAGLTLNLHLISRVIGGNAVLFILNDNTADGHDVSWIWDVDFSSLKSMIGKSKVSRKTKIYIAGTRGLDMALRLKYEGIEYQEVFDSLSEAIEKIDRENPGMVYVLPTYTAMLEFRKEIGKLTKVNRIHE